MAMTVHIACDQDPKAVISPESQPVCSPAAVAKLSESVIQTRESGREAETMLEYKSESVHKKLKSQQRAQQYAEEVTVQESDREDCDRDPDAANGGGHRSFSNCCDLIVVLLDQVGRLGIVLLLEL